MGSDDPLSIGSRPQSAGSLTADLEAGTLESNVPNHHDDTDLSVDTSPVFNDSTSSGLSLASYVHPHSQRGYPAVINENEDYVMNGGRPSSVESNRSNGSFVIVNLDAEGGVTMHSSRQNGWGGTKLQISATASDSLDTVSTSSNSPQASPSSEQRRGRTIRFAESNQVRTYVPNPDEFQDNPTDLFDRSSPTCGGKARSFLAVHALSFTYGATSSITTLYFFHELLVRYGIDKRVIGAYLAGAYFSRVVFTSISRYAPKTCILIGSISALIGFVAIFVSQSPQFMGLDETVDYFKDDGLTLFIAGSILANCNETIGAMQMLVRDQHLDNIKVMGSQLKRHFFMAKLARICSFASGGYIYHTHGVEGLAVLGAGMVSIQIVILVWFLLLDLFRPPDDPNNAFGDSAVDLKPKCRMSCSIQASRGRRRMFKSAMSKLNRTLCKYYPSLVPPSSVRYIVPLCVFGRTLSSICIWSSSTVIMVDDFEQNFITVGVIFASAAAFDFLISLLELNEEWHQRYKKKLARPNEIFLCMGGITLSSIVVAVPNLYAFVAGFLLYVICNSTLKVALTELQGSSENAMESITVQLLRRLCTAATLYSLPLLYSLHPRLPLVMALWFALLSSLVLAVFLTFCRKSSDVETVDDDDRSKKLQPTDSVRKLNSRPSKRPERNLLYAERVMLGRLIKGKDV